MTEPESEFVDVVLLVAPKPISVIHAIDVHSSLNAKQAKKLVESAPATIFTRMPHSQAVAITLELQAWGALFRLDPVD